MARRRKHESAAAVVLEEERGPLVVDVKADLSPLLGRVVVLDHRRCQRAAAVFAPCRGVGLLQRTLARLALLVEAGGVEHDVARAAVREVVVGLGA